MLHLDIDAALPRWAEATGGHATLINLSENHTFRVDGPAGRCILRLHRPGYQTAAAIRSELAWVEALRRDTALPVPQPLVGLDDQYVQELASGRCAVLFAFEPGAEPGEDDVPAPLFRTLGAFAATLHLHAREWALPEGFTRPTWDAAAILDADGLWGNWRLAPGVDEAIRPTLGQLDRRLRDDLGAYGTGSARFGLIHADMRLANLLVDGDRVTLIDFDDCGFGWHLYDLAASLSFIEISPQATALRQSWIEGYTAVRPLEPEDLAMVDAMILLRRMALLAWIGSHGETELAQRHAGRFAADTARLAADYLG